MGRTSCGQGILGLFDGLHSQVRGDATVQLPEIAPYVAHRYMRQETDGIPLPKTVFRLAYRRKPPQVRDVSG